MEEPIDRILSPIAHEQTLISCVRVAETVRHSKELEVLRDGIDCVEQGIVLINEALQVEFMNKKALCFWSLDPKRCHGRLSLDEFIDHVRRCGLWSANDEEMDAYASKHIMLIKTGDPTPIDIPVKDGKIVRAQCTALVGGSRMLTYTDITDLVQRVKEQELLATFDVLTGLFNRRHFQKLADAEWARCHRYGHDLSLLFIDIDNLKAINDTLGHDVGDRAITRVAEACNAVKRTSDIAGRIGGDEFLILVPDSDKYAALALAERLHTSIRGGNLIFDGFCMRLTVSIGIAQAEAEFDDMAGLLKRADTGLLKAKREGRNSTALCDEPEIQSLA
jgi:diguanylate cyclase (GGDEF)-like protein